MSALNIIDKMKELAKFKEFFNLEMLAKCWCFTLLRKFWREERMNL